MPVNTCARLRWALEQYPPTHPAVTSNSMPPLALPGCASPVSKPVYVLEEQLHAKKALSLRVTSTRRGGHRWGCQRHGTTGIGCQ